MIPVRNRGRYWSVVVAAVTLLAMLGTANPSPGAGAKARRRSPGARPNILVVMTDDQRFDTMDVMLQTRRWMTRKATVFEQAFATTPQCCPSRASVLTGRYAHNHMVLRNSDGPLLDHSTTIQRYLQDAGYKTAMLGKLLNAWNVKSSPQYWDKWAVLAPISGKANGYYDSPFNVNGRVRTVESYSTDFISHKAHRFLDSFESQDSAPWFIYVTPFAPHGPPLPASRHEEAAVAPWTSNPAVEESDVTDKPHWVQRAVPDPERLTQLALNQRRTLLAVDEMFSDLRKKMRKLGELDNTLIFFLSDNGFMWGEHGITGKKSPYERSVRVPFAMSWPERILAGEDDRIVGTIDIAPTILDAASVTPPFSPPMDGRSLLSGPPRAEILIEFWQAKEVPGWAAIRSHDFQYNEWHDGQGNPYFLEYYDLASDSWQLDNVLGDGDPTNDIDTRELSARLVEYRNCAGFNCP
jgi:arylsulfatase A-like enzyme